MGLHPDGVCPGGRDEGGGGPEKLSITRSPRAAVKCSRTATVTHEENRPYQAFPYFMVMSPTKCVLS